MSFINEFPHTDFYGSDLRELLHMYKTLAEEYDSIKENIDNCNKLYNDIFAANSGLSAKVNAIEKELATIQNTLISVIESKFTALEKSVDSKLDKCYSDMTLLIDNVRLDIRRLKTFITSQVAQVKEEVDHKFNKFCNDTSNKVALLQKYVDKKDSEIIDMINNIKVDQSEVISPVDKVQKPIQEVLDEIYYNLNAWALTAYEYDSCFITAERYDSLRIDVLEYDCLGKWYVCERELFNRRIDCLFKEVKRSTVAYSPFSGLDRGIIELFYEMASYLRDGALDADTYDLLLLTVDEYEGYDMTAYIYDWYAHVVLISNSSVLTANRYDNLLMQAYQYDARKLSALDYDMYGSALLIGA